MAEHATPLIEAQALVKHYGPTQAVRGITFKVARGEVVGFLGPNGAGKSTTMKMLTGFLKPPKARPASTACRCKTSHSWLAGP